MSEQTMRSRLVRDLKPLHAVPVENRVMPGTPDVNYIEGWIELKWLRRWPKGDDTVVKLDHFTPQQRIWLNRRWEQGGNAWLILQVGKEWLLFTGRDAKEYVGKLTRSGLYRCVRARWPEGLKKKELMECLTRDWENWDGLPMVSGSSWIGVGEERPSSRQPPVSV